MFLVCGVCCVVRGEPDFEQNLKIVPSGRQNNRKLKTGTNFLSCVLRCLADQPQGTIHTSSIYTVFSWSIFQYLALKIQDVLTALHCIALHLCICIPA
jgi:hypothetical protein